MVFTVVKRAWLNVTRQSGKTSQAIVTGMSPTHPWLRGAGNAEMKVPRFFGSVVIIIIKDRLPCVGQYDVRLLVSDNTMSDYLVSDNTMSDYLVTDNTVSNYLASDNTMSDYLVSGNTMSSYTEAYRVSERVLDSLMSERLCQLKYLDGCLSVFWSWMGVRLLAMDRYP